MTAWHWLGIALYGFVTLVAGMFAALAFEIGGKGSQDLASLICSLLMILPVAKALVAWGRP